MPTFQDIDDQRKLLETHRRTLALHLRQQAAFGNAYVQPAVVNGIYEARTEIRRIKDILVKWGEQVEEHPDDEFPYSDSSMPSTISVPPSVSPRRAWRLVHPYAIPANFTGRRAERTLMDKWLHEDQQNRLLIVQALGGFGKSAMCWFWLCNDVEPARWPKVLWWSFYESAAGFDAFVRFVLDYLGGNPHDLSPRQQADELLNRLRQSRILLVLDGFERELRAFSGMGAAYQGDEGHESEATDRRTDQFERDCVNHIAQYFLRNLALDLTIEAKVLMSTRLRPRVVEARGGQLLQGCCELRLAQMQPDDAVAFFRAEGVRGRDVEIRQACERYGYHPLSMHLLAGIIMSDLQQRGDIAAAQRLDVSGDLVRDKHHVLEQAYELLLPEHKKLIGQIACFRSPVEYKALRELSDTPALTFDSNVQDLIKRGLLQCDQHTARFDLHPIVRRYIYDRLTSEERGTTHHRLRDYFAAVPSPEKIERLEDLAPVIELYHHTIRMGQFDEAWLLLKDRLDAAVSRQFTAVDRAIELFSAVFPDGESSPPRLSSLDERLEALKVLSQYYSVNGHPKDAVPLVHQYVVSCEEPDPSDIELRELLDPESEFSEYFLHRSPSDIELRGMINLAVLVYLPLGKLRDAENLIRRGIAVAEHQRNKEVMAFGQLHLGLLFLITGRWKEAETQLREAEKALEYTSSRITQRSLQITRAMQGLVLARTYGPENLRYTSIPLLYRRYLSHSLAAAQSALEVIQQDYVEYFYIRARWLLGAVQRMRRDIRSSEQHLDEALNRCRRAGITGLESDILLDLARLRQSTGASTEALQLAEEALDITERSGYTLQGADVNLFLARRAIEAGDHIKALPLAREAHKLSTCDGSPNYTYKVAFNEAGILLRQLGQNTS